MGNRLNKKKINLILLTGISYGLINSLQAPQAFAQPWAPICVRQPVDITPLNTASNIKQEDCQISGTQASLNGQPGYLTKYTFRDGKIIRIFSGGCSNRFGPCQIKISTDGSEWFDGIYELPDDLIYQCGEYACNWYTFRDGSGKLVLATAMSY